MTKRAKKAVSKNLEKARAALAAKRAVARLEAETQQRNAQADAQAKQAATGWIASPVNQNTLAAIEKGLQDTLQQVTALRARLKGLL